MRRRRPEPAGAIATGIFVIAFALFYQSLGIFPFKVGWQRHALTAAEDPVGFPLLVYGSLVAGGAALLWGLLGRR